jgi:hypothetical protein
VTRRPIWKAAGWAALSLQLLLGCDKDKGTGATTNAPLFEFNAQANGGRTVRWANLPVRVFLGDGVAQAGEVTVWTGATGGAVTFTFVGSGSGPNVSFRFRGGTDICGLSTIEYTDDGLLTFVDIQVSQAIYRGPQCVRTVTHETGHGIGFLGHTKDGGLMDDDGGDGEITPTVTQVLRDLYSLPPGTLVSAQTKRLGLRRPGGKNVMTFIYPVRP